MGGWGVGGAAAPPETRRLTEKCETDSQQNKRERSGRQARKREGEKKCPQDIKTFATKLRYISQARERYCRLESLLTLTKSCATFARLRGVKKTIIWRNSECTCRMYKGRKIRNMSETVFHKVDKVSPNSTTHKVNRFYKGVFISFMLLAA